MTFTHMQLAVTDHQAVITINRPPANAWNLGAMTEFKAILDRVETDASIRVILLTGAGEKCFSAGFDVSDEKNGPTTAAMGRELWRRIDRFPKPVIAVINGHALGGGLELALCCHFRLMAEDTGARIGLTELNLGIIPGWGGTQRLMRLTGRQKALEMILFSQRLSASEALDAGVLNGMAPADQLMETARKLAEQISRRPPLAVKGTLDAMSAGLYEGIDKGLDVEAIASETVMASTDATEGFTAFLEKRDPTFRGE